jgi:hypothetical protein
MATKLFFHWSGARDLTLDFKLIELPSKRSHDCFPQRQVSLLLQGKGREMMAYFGQRQVNVACLKRHENQ